MMKSCLWNLAPEIDEKLTEHFSSDVGCNIYFLKWNFGTDLSVKFWTNNLSNFVSYLEQMHYWFIIRNRVSDNDFGYIFLDHNWYQCLFIICKKKSALLRADFVSIYVLIISDKITVAKIVSVINTYNFASLRLCVCYVCVPI